VASPPLPLPRPRDIPPSVRDSPLAAPVRLPRGQSLLRLAILMAVIVWAWAGTGITLPTLIEGLPDMANFVSRLFPPNLAAIGEAIALWWVAVPFAGEGVAMPVPALPPAGPLFETVQMAITGTLLAVAIAMPLSLLAAANISPHPAIYQSARAVLNVGRTIPELVLALAFVAAVGLGAFPGTLALALHSVFSLSKIFAEAIEAINPRQVEAVRAAGASRLQTIAYAVMPQALPVMLSYSLLYWEHNIRAATVLGLVGAGGIGFKIQVSMRLFQYNDLTMYVILLVVMVTLIDRFSAFLRARIT
jgi:phosphonate transport system permease protein